MVVSPLLSPGVLVAVPSGDSDNRLLPVLPPLVSVPVGVLPLVSVPVGVLPLVSAESDDSIDDCMVFCRDDGALLSGGGVLSVRLVLSLPLLVSVFVALPALSMLVVPPVLSDVLVPPPLSAKLVCSFGETLGLSVVVGAGK
jgi:hypothetical protein